MQNTPQIPNQRKNGNAPKPQQHHEPVKFTIPGLENEPEVTLSEIKGINAAAYIAQQEANEAQALADEKQAEAKAKQAKANGLAAKQERKQTIYKAQKNLPMDKNFNLDTGETIYE